LIILSVIAHSGFLRRVFIHTLTAFGGPQAHFALLLKNFSVTRKDFTEKQLIDFSLFCQLIPGASSTQLLFLLGYKKGGLFLGLWTLIIWILPATLFMGTAAIYFTAQADTSSILKSFRFLHPMVIGFISYAAYRSFLLLNVSRLLIGYLALSTLLCLLFYKSPWIFPIVLFLGALTTMWIPPKEKKSPTPTLLRIRWFPLTLFFCLFLISGSLSGISKKEDWIIRPHLNLFENCYRFGSLVFGGGDVLIPLMYEQYVARPSSKRILNKNQNVLKLDKSLFLTGAGLIRTIPGPVFSFSAFTGSALLEKKGPTQQILGILIATIAIFLPSILLVLFFYPLWEYSHRYPVLLNSLQGIQAATIGIMLSSSIYLSKDLLFSAQFQFSSFRPDMAMTIVATFLMLRSQKMPTPFIACIFLLLGFFF
jgi:chromate transporter